MITKKDLETPEALLIMAAVAYHSMGLNGQTVEKRAKYAFDRAEAWLDEARYRLKARE